MYRVMLVSLLALSLVAGCAQTQPKMEEMKKPAVAPEMAKLQCWLGTWSGTSEFVSPSYEEMKKMMPPGAKEPPKTYAGGEKVEWALGGMALKSEGWYDVGEGRKINYSSYGLWDPKAKNYHGWSFNDWGQVGEYRMTCDPSGKTFRVTEKTVDAQGRPGTGEGVMTFVDDKTIEWTFSQSGPEGNMKLKGTSKKQP